MVSLLISRAWVAEDVGLSPWESHAILRGALVLAEAWDLADPRAARSGRTSWPGWGSSIRRQRWRSGEPDSMSWLVWALTPGFFLGNVIDAALFTGDWDLVLELTDRFERADETPKTRLGRVFGRVADRRRSRG